MAGLYVFIFIGSAVMLAFSGSWLVDALARIARFLGWREFIVAFFVMSIGASMPELLIGISSAIKGIPELSFGNIVGANVIHFTLAIALCILILKNIEVESRILRATTVFTVIAAILPMVLILDGSLSRIDGLILILSYALYMGWLFSKKERFATPFNAIDKEKPSFTGFLKDFGILIGGTILILLSAQGIVLSATYFAEFLKVPLILIGILVVGLGTALPETYFSLAAAKKGQSWMLLGSLMGSTATTATLILGIVALLQPIFISDFSPFIMARTFLIISAIYFLISVRTGQKISYREGIFLFSLYILFVLLELLQH